MVAAVQHEQETIGQARSGRVIPFGTNRGLATNKQCSRRATFSHFRGARDGGFLASAEYCKRAASQLVVFKSQSCRAGPLTICYLSV